MNRQQTLIKNTVIIGIGKISTQFLTFLLLPLYTTHLMKSEYGLVDIIITYISLLAPLATIQLEMAAFRFLIERRKDDIETGKVISSLFRLVGLTTLVFITGFICINAIFPIPHGLLVLITILTVIATNMMLQVTRGLGNNVLFSIGSALAGVTTVIANIILIAHLGMGVDGALLAIIIGDISCTAFLFISQRIHKYISFRRRDSVLEKDLLRYSTPLLPSSVSWWLINAADRTIVAIVLGVASSGIYAVAYKFPLIFSGLFSFFNMSWTESASVNIDKSDRDEFFSQTMNASIRLFGSLGLCIVAGVSLVFTLLVSKTYHEAYLYIPLLILGSFFNSMVSMYGAIYIAKKMTKQVMNSSIIAAGISIILTVCLIPWLGLFAPALAMVAAYGSMVAYRHYDVKKYVNINYDYKALAILALAFVAVATLYYINRPLLNILNVFVALGFSIILNRSIISIIKTKLFARLRPLTPDQQILEEIEEKKL